jgi:hypothetical protein
MNLRQTLLQPRIVASLGLCLAAAVVGMVLGYDFGVRVGGTRWLGLVAALCSGVFCTLMVDALLSRLISRLVAKR